MRAVIHLSSQNPVVFSSWAPQMAEHQLVSGDMSEGTLTLVCKSMSGIYALALFTWYMALATTKIFAYETYFSYLNEDVFEAILFLPSIAFLTYVISITTYQRRNADKMMVAENIKVWT